MIVVYSTCVSSFNLLYIGVSFSIGFHMIAEERSPVLILIVAVIVLVIAVKGNVIIPTPVPNHDPVLVLVITNTNDIIILDPVPNFNPLVYRDRNSQGSQSGM